jgi:hypothetical protein
MRQIVYTSAVGSCVLGTGAAPVRAAEWSITPIYSVSVDYDSNRRLLLEAKGSEAAVVTADLTFKRAMEDWDVSIEPRYSFRRFSDRSFGNGDDRSVYAALNRLTDGYSLNLTGSYWDQSTLLTEVLETGIVSANTHRRQGQAGANWTWTQTEVRELIAQINFTDVSYYGQGRAQLPGFRYPSASLGERFAFSERGSLTFSTYGSVLSSDTPGNSSHEVGLQAEIIYSFSESTRVDGSVGESSRVLSGQSSYGTDASISLTHTFTQGVASASYTRSLVPYGNGFLVERQQATASLTHPLTPYIDGTLSFTYVNNNHTTVQLEIDRASYDIASAGVSWHPSETWAIGAQAQALRTQSLGLPAGTVNDWRTYFTVTWTPHPWSLSR